MDSYGEGSEKVSLRPIRKLVDPHIPQMLYRMFPCEPYAKEFVLQDKTGTTSSITFNDPFDTMPMIDAEFNRKKVKEWWRIELGMMYEIWKDNSKFDSVWPHTTEVCKKVILQFINTIPSEQYFIDRFENEEFTINEITEATNITFYEALRDVRKSTFVACFTERIDNMLMWSHYTRSHRGFALGYDFSLPENAEAKEMLFPVIYSDEKINMTLEIGFVADRHVEGDYKYA